MSVRFPSLRNLTFVGAAAAALLASGASARADVFDLTYSGVISGSPVSGDLVLTASPVPPGPITVYGEQVATGTGVTGTLNGTDPATGAVNGYFNRIYPLGYAVNGGLYLDSSGLVFTDTVTGHNIELWATGFNGVNGVYNYQDLTTLAGGVLTSLSLTTPGAPGPLPGAGLASLSLLLVAGAALKARRFAAR